MRPVLASEASSGANPHKAAQNFPITRQSRANDSERHVKNGRDHLVAHTFQSRPGGSKKIARRGGWQCPLEVAQFDPLSLSPSADQQGPLSLNPTPAPSRTK